MPNHGHDEEPGAERISDRPSVGMRMKREAEHLLRPFEAFLLPRLARSLPVFVLPDHLTALATAAAVAAGACLARSGEDPAWLWAANALLLVHWFGDSLDGTLARERRIERPRYGFYLDHLMDMVSVAAVLCGYGLSPQLDLSTALFVVAVYYLVAINTHLELKTLGNYVIAYGGFGPTEARLLLMACNALLAFGLLPSLELAGMSLAPLDLPASLIAFGMLALAARRSLRNLRLLAEREPKATRRV